MAGLLASAFEYIQQKSEKFPLLHNLKRAILPLIVGAVVFSGLLFSSTVAYFIFYWSYIPSVGVASNIYLQFSQDAPPWGTVDLASANLLNTQPYAAFVELELPRTQHNLDLGNFMLILSLVNQFNETVISSSRPAILTYTSPIISTSSAILNLPLFLAGFKKESETLLVPVLEQFQFPNSRAGRPRSATIKIVPAGNRIQVYHATLIFVAQFEGVRWFMYSHRFIAFVIFTSLFFTSSSLFAGLTWFLISLRISTASAGDDINRGAPKPLPQTDTVKKCEPPENDEAIASMGTDLSIPSLSSSEEARQASQSLANIPSQRHPAHKSRSSYDSSTSAQERDEPASIVPYIKTEDDSTSLEGDMGDDDAETIERRPISEAPF